MENKVKFAVNDIVAIDDKSSKDFFIAKMKFLSCGDNSQGLIISEEILRRDASTALGKWVVADFQPWVNDVTTHTSNEKIVGVIPRDSVITFEDSDNGVFACAEVILSKVYASEVYNIFTKDNKRSVSVEMRTISDEKDENIIERFEIFGITILGKATKPSCELSDITITKFSADEANEYYHSQKDNLTNLKQFAEKRKNELTENKAYKVDKSKGAMVDTSWSDVDKNSMREKIMEAKNKSTLVKDVYLLVENDWENAPSEHLKYPIMQLQGDTFVYNRNAISSAKAYAEKENEQSVIDKLNTIYNKLELNKKEEGAKMAKEKFAIQGREAWGDIIAQVKKHEGEKIYVDSVEKDHIIYTKDKVRYIVEADVEVGKDDKNVAATIKWETVKKDSQQKKFDDDEADNDCENDKDEGAIDTEHKLSYNAYVDVGAMNEMLEKETQEYKDLITNKFNLNDMNVIMSDYLAKTKRVSELECEMAEIDKAKEDVKKKEIVDETFANLKSEITKDKVKEFTDKAKEFSLADINKWVDEVKLFAYDNGTPKSSKTENTQLFSFAGNNESVFIKHSTDTNTNTSVFAKHLNK
ncbi:MAG: hypothetical protein RSF81_04860 [Oscillospiraceae bacterium]